MTNEALFCTHTLNFAYMFIHVLCEEYDYIHQNYWTTDYSA